MGESSGRVRGYGREVVSVVKHECLTIRQLLCLPPTAGSSKPNPNMYHPFQTLDQRFAESVKGMAREDEMNGG